MIIVTNPRNDNNLLENIYIGVFQTSVVSILMIDIYFEDFIQIIIAICHVLSIDTKIITHINLSYNFLFKLIYQNYFY